MRRPPPDPKAIIAAHEGGRACRAALMAAVLAGVGELGFAIIDAGVYPDLNLPLLRCLHALLCAGLVALLLARWRTPSVRLGNVVFAAVAIPFFVIFWLAELKVAGLGKPWVPFLGHKLVMVGLAFLAPTSFWLTSGLIAGLSLESLVLWYTFDESIRSELGAWEPWVTILFGGLAVALLAYRTRSLDVERRFSRSRTKAENIQRLARLFLAVRDQTNTPLQTIEIATMLLRSRYADAGETLDKIEHAVTQLKELSKMLSGFDDLMMWSQDDESIDAQALFYHIQHVGAEETPPPPPRRRA